MNETAILCWSAAAIGTVHTFLGPDHYLPFVAMSRAGHWSPQKTLIVTSLCGVGHVFGSVVLGLVGIALGTAVFHLERVEAVRGDIAAWMLIGFGLLYFAWATVRAIRNRPHSHWHSHDGQTVHCHKHRHDTTHLHVHADATPAASRPSLTPWILFTIFLFGPCEPLIPLLMYPAAAGSLGLVALVTLVFASATIVTMTFIVWSVTSSRFALKSEIMARFSAPLAGLVVIACGFAMKAGF
jgi:ABC-type nickel/cobalt efflux system permease component RcnA